MSFFYKPYKKIQCTLQDRCIKNNNGAQAIRKIYDLVKKFMSVMKALRKKRALRFACFSALMTVETAMVLPVFLLAVFTLLNVMHMIGTNQQLLTIAAKRLHKAVVYSYSDDYGIENIMMELVLEVGRSDMDLTGVNGGAAGIDYWGTDYDEQTGEIHICMSCSFNSLFRLFNSGSSDLSVSLSSRAFIGGKMFCESNVDNTENQKIVFVAQNGVVYHSSRECAHIDLSIHGVRALELEGLRNNQGGKYYPCELCANSDFPAVIYLTDTGNRYHCSSRCSGISRDIYEMVWTPDCILPPCSRCAR